MMQAVQTAGYEQLSIIGFRGHNPRHGASVAEGAIRPWFVHYKRPDNWDDLWELAEAAILLHTTDLLRWWDELMALFGETLNSVKFQPGDAGYATGVGIRFNGQDDIGPFYQA